MYNILLALTFVSPAQAADKAPRAGIKVEVALPAQWDDDTKTVIDQGYILVNEADSVNTCTFLGGAVKVTKVSKGQVYFETVPAPKSGHCHHLMTSLEHFQQWGVAAVKKQKAEWEKMASEFHQKLKEDVKAIVEKAADPCAHQDRELKTGNVYKLTGRVFLYGTGTTASAVDGGNCQVELGGFVEIQGFNRGSDHAVAVYHRPENSSGFVLAGPQHAKTETCKDSSQIVFSLTRMKEHFKFAEPTTQENMAVKGIASALNGKKIACINDVNAGDSDHSRKIERNSSTGEHHEEGGHSGDVAPAQ